MLFDTRPPQAAVMLDDKERGAWIRYTPRFLELTEAQTLFDTLHATVPFEQERPVMMGTPILVKRKSRAFGDEGLVYRYAGLTKEALPWTDPLLVLKQKVEAFTGTTYNFALCLLYPDGDAGLGWHSDSEKDMVEGAMIASVSLGEERQFNVRKKNAAHELRGGKVLMMTLNVGSLLVMGGACQKHYEHELVKTKTIKKPRINLTFRQIVRS